jgi:hypothetical protein
MNYIIYGNYIWKLYMRIIYQISIYIYIYNSIQSLLEIANLFCFVWPGPMRQAQRAAPKVAGPSGPGRTRPGPLDRAHVPGPWAHGLGPRARPGNRALSHMAGFLLFKNKFPKVMNDMFGGAEMSSLDVLAKQRNKTQRSGRLLCIG